MIKQLRTKNFQSSLESVYDFHPGINVITGISQAGKSASTIKPLQLVKNNRPSGGRYLSNACGDEGDTEIHVVLQSNNFSGGAAKELDGNDSITLTKHIKKDKEGRKKVESTVYKVGDYKFSHTGVDVPDKVTEVLNLSEINIRGQHDDYFLITSTPGEIAKTINNITKLDRADEWVSDLTKQINDSTKEVKRLEASVFQTGVKLKKYVGIEKAEALIDRVEDLDKKIDAAKDNQMDIWKVRQRTVDIENEIKSKEGILSAEKFVLEAEELNEEILALEEEKGVIGSYLDACFDVDGLSKVVIDLEAFTTGIDVIEETLEVMIEERDIIDDYLEAMDNVSLKTCRKEVAEKELSALLIKMGKCPTCFGKVDTKTINRILEEL